MFKLTRSRFRTEPISERLSAHHDRYVETLSSATRTVFSIFTNSNHSTWVVHITVS